MGLYIDYTDLSNLVDYSSGEYQNLFIYETLVSTFEDIVPMQKAFIFFLPNIYIVVKLSSDAKLVIF